MVKGRYNGFRMQTTSELSLRQTIADGLPNRGVIAVLPLMLVISGDKTIEKIIKVLAGLAVRPDPTGPQMKLESSSGNTDLANTPASFKDATRSPLSDVASTQNH